MSSPELKAYTEDAKELAAATYPCPVCQKEDGVMYADGSWRLGGKKGNANLRVLQWKCSVCKATLRRVIKEKAETVVQPTEASNAQPQQATPPAS